MGFHRFLSILLGLFVFIIGVVSVQVLLCPLDRSYSSMLLWISLLLLSLLVRAQAYWLIFVFEADVSYGSFSPLHSIDSPYTRSRSIQGH